MVLKVIYSNPQFGTSTKFRKIVLLQLFFFPSDIVDNDDDAFVEMKATGSQRKHAGEPSATGAGGRNRSRAPPPPTPEACAGPRPGKDSGNQGLWVLTGENAVKHIGSFDLITCFFPLPSFCFRLLNLDP